jgi:hypothetical protein
MLANIQLNPNVLIDPALAEVVEKLALKHPSWVFRSHAKLDSSEYSAGGSHQLGVRGDAPPAGHRFTRTISVVQDGLLAGKIGVDRNYSQRATQNWHYILNSARINNGRKGNQLTTRDPALALRTVSREFSAPSISEMLGNALAAAYDGLDSTYRNLERPIERGQYAPSLVHMQIALYKLLKDVPFDERSLREKLLSDTYEEALANFELAQCMRVRHAHLQGLIVFRGNYVYPKWSASAAGFDKAQVISGERETLTSAFEELPQAWQDKIAVLQLMRDHELVLDVGYRYNDSTFLIVT